MAAGYPVKENYANGDVLTATNLNDLAGTVNFAVGTTPNTGTQMAGKNAIINGDFGINQRGFTTNTTTGTYLFDRFTAGMVGGTVTNSSQTFTAGTAPVTGYEATNYLRTVISGQSATTDYAEINQRIEDVRTFAGQTVTLSLWAKADAAKNITFRLSQNFGSGGSATAHSVSSVIPITTSWARYSYTVTLPSISGKTIGSNSFLIAGVFFSQGSAVAPATGLGLQSGTFEIWGVQLEAGSKATPFQTATGTKQGELAACQRYYWRATTTDNYVYFPGNGLAKSTTVAEITVPNPVTMRGLPSSIEYSNVNVSDGVTLASGGTITLSSSTPIAVHFTVTYGSGLTQYRTYFMQGATGTSYLAVNSEL